LSPVKIQFDLPEVEIAGQIHTLEHLHISTTEKVG